MPSKFTYVTVASDEGEPLSKDEATALAEGHAQAGTLLLNEWGHHMQTFSGGYMSTPPVLTVALAHGQLATAYASIAAAKEPTE